MELAIGFPPLFKTFLAFAVQGSALLADIFASLLHWNILRFHDIAPSSLRRSPSGGIVEDALNLLVVVYWISFVARPEVKYFAIAPKPAAAGPKHFAPLEP